MAPRGELAVKSFALDADSLKTGVFVRRRAREGESSIGVRSNRGQLDGEDALGGASLDEDAPLFERTLRDESDASRRARRDACARAWGALDGHCQAVADDANAEAFGRVRTFAEAAHRSWLARSENGSGEVCGGVVDERVPVGVILAGGVNSDDHEETFAALTRSLRETGRAHCALLRSRDLKARAGVGAGGLAVAFGVIMRQLDREGKHWGGKSMRALWRWHAETLERAVEKLGDGSKAVGPSSPGPLVVCHGDDDVDFGAEEGVATKKRARAGDDSLATSPTRRATRRRAREDAASARGRGAGAAKTNDEWFPIIKGRNCPVVIVVEDTESFDARVLDSFLRSVSEFAARVPVIVLLGLATSVSSLQGMLPASTAALLNAQAFQLWAPGRMMEAVQERVLLSPERVPAFGSEVLGLLHTRFKEHDFSLAAVRRSLHLLTLTHFMTEPLSAVLPLLASDPREQCADGEDSDDEYGDAIDQFVRGLGPNELEYARKKHGMGASSRSEAREDVEESSASRVRADLSAALKDVYRLRRRWALSLRCIQVACAATEEKLKGSVTTKMADLLLDASRKGFFSGVGTDQSADTPHGRRASLGDSLIAITCSRVRDEFTTADIASLIPSMLTSLDEDELMRSAEGSELRFLLSRIEEGAFDNEDARLRHDRARNGVRELPKEPTPSSNILRELSEEDEKRRAIEILLNNRKRRGGGGVATMTPEQAVRDTEHASDDDDGGLVLPQSPIRGRSAPAAINSSVPSNALVVVNTPAAPAASAVSAAAAEFCDILRSIARKYASRPPESLPASGIFVVTDIDCVRAALQASPRLALENTLTDPSEILRCSCCRRDEYDLKAYHRVPSSLPDAAAAYRLLARFGEQAAIYDWFQSFCECKTNGVASGVSSAAAQARGKGTFGLPREKLWELQARFTRAVAELEFLGIARPYQKGRKRVEYMVRTAFPLDKLARDSHATRVVDRLAITER